MSSYKEDEDFFRLVREIVGIEEEIELCQSSQLRAVPKADKIKQLEKRREELNDQYINSIIQLDRIRIRETPYIKPMMDLLRGPLGYGSLDIKEIWSDYFQEILEFHQDNELINRGGFVRNYFMLIPPYVKVGTNIPDKIKKIYHESRWCFVYGQYSATIAMCRTVIETVLKTKFDLSGDLDKIIDTASERGLITEKTKWNAHKVRTFANKIMHTARPSTGKEAKNSIDHVLAFLEEIYF